MDKELKKIDGKFFFFILLFILFGYMSVTFINNKFGGDTYFYISNSSILIKLILASIVYYLLDAYRLAYILNALGEEKLPFTYLLKLSFINVFFSNITPMATGGGFLQIYLLTRKGVRLSRAVAASSIRTAFALLLFLLLVPVSILSLDKMRMFFFSSENIAYSGSILVAYFIFLFGMLKIIKSRKSVVRIFLYIRKRFNLVKSNKRAKEIVREINGFYDSLDILWRKPAVFAMSLFISLLFLMSLFFIPYLLIINFGGNPSLVEVLSTQSIVTFFTYFAFTPGASGLAEVILTMFYKEMIPGQFAGAFALMWRLFTIYVPLILGAGCFLELIMLERKVESKHLK